MIMQPTNLTKEEKKFLESKGFTKDKSGYFCLETCEDVLESIALIPLGNKEYKLEIYTTLFDHLGDSYQDFSKVFSEKNQTLKQFIEEYLD